MVPYIARIPAIFIIIICLFFRFLERKYSFNIKTYNICHVK